MAPEEEHRAVGGRREGRVRREVGHSHIQCYITASVLCHVVLCTHHIHVLFHSHVCCYMFVVILALEINFETYMYIVIIHNTRDIYTMRPIAS